MDPKSPHTQASFSKPQSLNLNEELVLLEPIQQDDSGAAATPRSFRPAEMSWSQLCDQVKRAKGAKGVVWDKEAVIKEQEPLILLAAVKVGNDSIVSELKDIGETSGKVDLQELALTCLKTCILAGQEDLACGCVELFKHELPLYLMHRAGEQAMLRFLYSLYRLKVPICTNSVITAIPVLIPIVLKHETNYQSTPRFPAKQRFLTQQEVFRWAAIAHGSQGLCQFASQHPDLSISALIQVLLEEGFLDLLDAYLAKATIDAELILTLLKYRQIQRAIGIVLDSYKSLGVKTPKPLRFYQVIHKLIELISDPEVGIPALFLLSLIKEFDWNPIEFDALLDCLRKALIEEDIDSSAIVNSSNPLLFCVAVAELCTRLGEFSMHYRDLLQRIAEDFKQLAETIQGKYVDYRRLKVLYTEKAYGPLCLFDIVTRQTARYRLLLKSEIVASIVQDLWTGGDPGRYRFYLLSAVNQYFEDWEAPVFAAHREYLRVSFPASIFQLSYWKTNASVRFLVETLLLITLLGILISQLSLYLHIRKTLEDPELLMDANMSDLKNQMDTQKALSRVVVVMAGALVLNITQNFTYKWLRKEPFHLRLLDLLSVLFFLSSLALNILSDDSIQSEMDSDTNMNVQEYLYAIMMFSLCLRMSAILTQTRTFGPWIRMIFLVTKDIMVYLLLYFLAVLSFALTYVVLFRRELDQFGSIQRSIRTLFQWSVAGIDSEVFTTRVELGSVLAIGWGFVSTIILLNLLVGVLSVSFEALAPLVTADYVSLMYQSYSQTRYEEPFGALVVAPAPLNFLTICLVPIYTLCPAAARCLDPVFVVLSYQIWFGMGSILFILYCIGAAIVAYPYVLWELIRKRELLILLLWLLLGPFYLIFLIFLSYIRFARNMYASHVSTESPLLPSDILLPCSNFLTSLPTPSPSFIALSDLQSSLTRLPRDKKAFWKLSTVEKRGDSNRLRQAVDRINFSKAQMLDERGRNIHHLFALFASYKGETEAVVNVKRMKERIRKCGGNGEKLIGVNIPAVESALFSLREAGLQSFSQ